MIEAITRLDFAVLDFIQEHLTCKFLDWLAIVISGLWHQGIICIIIALVLLIIPKTRKTGLCTALAIVFGFVIGNLVIKNAVARVRPYDINTAVSLLVNRLSDFSFPSGHTLVSFETATVIFIREKKRFGIPALIIATMVALSRLYLYVHYPSDVIAGAVLGILFGIAGCFAGGKIYDFFKERAAKNRK